jgi:hypothetical protein
VRGQAEQLSGLMAFFKLEPAEGEPEGRRPGRPRADAHVGIRRRSAR